MQKIFEKDFNIERIVKEISVKLGISILEEDTLISFDEIQACDRALTSLKYFSESTDNISYNSSRKFIGNSNK